jgi:opacity protein-like surface antigen
MKTKLIRVRLAVLIYSLLSLSLLSHAQNYNSPMYTPSKIEVGIGIGPMFFLGDLGGTAGVGKTFLKDLNVPVARPSAGIYLNYHLTDWLGIRLGATVGGVKGDDALTTSAGGAEMDRKNRNLNFRSGISEANIAMELYPTVFLEKYEGLQGKLRPYIVGGVGVFHFNPETKLANGTWIKTAPLHLEGQGFAEYPDSKPYKLTQLNVLMGAGIKYYVKENMYVGFEVLHRKLFTDYVDDVSHNYYVDPPQGPTRNLLNGAIPNKTMPISPAW